MCYPGNMPVLIGFSYISVNYIYLCFGGSPGGSDGKESTCNAGNPGSIPGLEKSPGEGHGYPLQHSRPGVFHGQRSLGYHSPWGRKQSDTAEQVTLTFTSDTVPLESARICHLSVDLLTNFAILCKYRTN